ncbi:hypothetical protein XJ32_05255 [Helicobacter bilis]|uniref:Uncharacterized protein n=1 Tax=Helicobacter bilis TaxID=37372 RepID=A0A1Q2LGS0_9HELI|nr:hypothetical protein XJ32_05255 [Helicobacter bilis]
MSIYRLIVLAILTLAAPFILYVMATFCIFTLQYKIDIAFEVMSFGIGIFFLIILCIILNKFYSMRNALLSGLRMLSFLIGLLLLATHIFYFYLKPF